MRGWGKPVRRGALLLATIVLLTPAFRASAAGGDLDKTFGSNGRVTTDFGKQDRAYAWQRISKAGS
jgi:hypothetical protein